MPSETESDVPTENSGILFYSPPQTILQECWNVGLLFLPVVVMAHIVLAVVTSVQKSIESIPVLLFALGCILFLYWLDNRGEYGHV